MTISSETNRSGPFNGNGVTTVFAGGFSIADEEHVQVILADADDIETVQVLSTDYTVSGVGDETFDVTMLVAPASGETLTLIRNVPFVQEMDLENQGPFFAETIEAAFDLAVARDQQLQEQIDRAVKATVSSDIDPDEVIADLFQAAADAATAAAAAEAAVLGDIAAAIHIATSKATPIDADELPIVDTAAANVLKKLTWANLKATLFAAWGALVNGGTAKGTPVDADAFAIMDSAASSATKKLTWLSLKGALGFNVGLAATVAANALTIALKGADGNNPSATNPVSIAFRNATLATGTPVVRTVTGALSTVISSGSTAGHNSNINGHLYVYAIDNAGTVELAWSSAFFGQSGRISTTAEGGAGAADSGTVMYSTTARTNVAFTLIARMIDLQTAAGTWASAPSEIQLLPVDRYPVGFSVYRGTNQTMTNSTVVTVQFATEVFDIGDFYDAVTNTRFQPPPGKYLLGAVVNITATGDQNRFGVFIYKNGSVLHTLSDVYESGSVGDTIGGTCLVDANGTDYFDVRVFQSSGSDRTLAGTQAAAYFFGHRMPGGY